MYIVNTSFMVDPAIHDRWLESLRKHYLPLLAAQGFDKITFTRVLPATAEEHFTYSAAGGRRRHAPVQATGRGTVRGVCRNGPGFVRGQTDVVQFPAEKSGILTKRICTKK